MKKNLIEPKLKVIKLQAMDVIATSGESAVTIQNLSVGNNDQSIVTWGSSSAKRSTSVLEK